jgi:hypothetical protein
MIDCALISIPPLLLGGPHIGPALLKAYAQTQGYTVTCFNPSLDFAEIMTKDDLNSWPTTTFDDAFQSRYDIDTIVDGWVDHWLSFNPKLIGLSTHVWASEFFLGKICKSLRRKTNLIIVMGGPAAIELGDSALKNGWVDYHVVGDGEEAFINALEGKFDHPSFNSNIPHAVSNAIFTTAPSPDYSDVDYEKYRKLDPKNNRIFLIGSRGCVFDCSFCNVPALMKYRYKDGAKFAHEIKDAQKKYKPNFIEFADSLINGNLTQYRNLIRTLAELNKLEPDSISKIVAFYRIRPMAQTREEDFKLMSESGFYRLKIGVESGSEQVRNHIGKTETEEEIFYTFEMCRKYKLKVNLLIIVGYPTETIKDFEQTMDLLEKLSNRGFQDVIDRTVVNELYFSTDTGLSKQVAELQIQNAETNSKWTRVLPNGEVLNSAERVRRLQLVIDYIKIHFNPVLSVFSDKNKSTK